MVAPAIAVRLVIKIYNNNKSEVIFESEVSHVRRNHENKQKT